MALFVRLVRASWTEVESPPLALSLSPLSSSSRTKSLLWIQKPDGGLLQHTHAQTHTHCFSLRLSAGGRGCFGSAAGQQLDSV